VWDASSIVEGRISFIADCSSRGHLAEAWALFIIHCWANYLGGRVLFVGAAWSCKRWSLLVALSMLTGPCVHKKNITLWSSQIVSTKNSRTSCSCVSCGCISEQEIVGWGTAITLRSNSRQIHAWVTHLSTRGEQFRDHLLWLCELGKFLLTTANILIVWSMPTLLRNCALWDVCERTTIKFGVQSLSLQVLSNAQLSLIC